MNAYASGARSSSWVEYSPDRMILLKNTIASKCRRTYEAGRVRPRTIFCQFG
jgi:hypothetical protein